MRTKEYRRRKRQLSINRAKRFVKIMGTVFSTERNVRRYAENRCPCSCPMCGNQRKHWGQTRKEDLEDINFKEQLSGY